MMDAAVVKKSIETYFETLKAHGRSVSDKIKPAEEVFKRERKFLSYLDPEDLICMFCYQPLVVVVIDYYRQRPVYGCLKDRFMKGMQKIKWADHCGNCGKVLKLGREELEDQVKHMQADNVLTVCEKCLGRGNLLDDEDMKNVQAKKASN